MIFVQLLLDIGVETLYDVKNGYKTVTTSCCTVKRISDSLAALIYMVIRRRRTQKQEFKQLKGEDISR